MLPSSSERSARSAFSLRRPTWNSGFPSPTVRFSPSGSSTEKGTATPPTRLTKASIVRAADDMSLFPGYQAGLRPRSGRSPRVPGRFCLGIPKIEMGSCCLSDTRCRYVPSTYDHIRGRGMRQVEACLLTVTKLAAAAFLGLCLGIMAGDAEAGDEGPGSIIRVWPLEGGGPSGAGGTAFRILYRSTGLSGEPIEVSGAIFIPPGAPPPGGRDIIAWAHPTSGVVEACAPSLMPDLAGTIWGLSEMLARGYVVVATDYPGLGTPGIHPYLIGVSEGRAVLDSVRAARDLPDAGASNRFAVWGHSQGGHASLFTGELAASYAPDLKLVGVAVAAPATYLIELFDADKSSPAGKELTAMALY